MEDTALLIEHHPEGSKAVGVKMAILFLGNMLLVVPSAGLAFYGLRDWQHVASATVGVGLVVFFAVLYWALVASMAVYRVLVSEEGLDFEVVRTSRYLPRIDGHYCWTDVGHYAYEVGDTDSGRTKCRLQFLDGEPLTFYCLRFWRWCQVVQLYQALRRYVPEREGNF